MISDLESAGVSGPFVARQDGEEMKISSDGEDDRERISLGIKVNQLGKDDATVDGNDSQSASEDETSGNQKKGKPALSKIDTLDLPDGCATSKYSRAGSKTSKRKRSKRCKKDKKATTAIPSAYGDPKEIKERIKAQKQVAGDVF